MLLKLTSTWEAAVRRLLNHRENEVEKRMQALGFELPRETAQRIESLLKQTLENGPSPGTHIDLLNARSLSTILGKGAMVKKGWTALDKEKLLRNERPSFFWHDGEEERRCLIRIVRDGDEGEPSEPIAG